jgi:putative Holliday junction resolvase
MARILAFDYGKRRVGIAVTDPLQIIANTLPTVETKVIWDWIKHYCASEDVVEFVVGWPYNYGHRDNPVIPLIEQFIAKLEVAYPGKPIHKVDERFTSKMASQTLLLSGVNKKARQKKENIDAISANIILQSFLEGRNR